MLWIIISWLLKSLGMLVIFARAFSLCFSLPRNIQQYKDWHAKQSASLHVMAREFRINGKRPKFNWFKRKIFKLTKMPCAHIWDIDDDQIEKRRLNNKKKCISQK